MNKKGFTLAELLISMTIIGVVAALTAPLLSNLVPDKSKVMVLNAYNAINKVTQAVLDDESIYYSVPSPAEPTVASCVGLGCINQPVANGYNNATYTGLQKYGALLSDQLSADGTMTVAGDVVTFTMQDEVTCQVQPHAIFQNVSVRGGGRVAQMTVPATIILTLPNTSCAGVFSNACTDPDQFRLNVDTRGKISPVDALSRAYFETQEIMNNKRVDVERARDILGGNY